MRALVAVLILTLVVMVTFVILVATRSLPFLDGAGRPPTVSAQLPTL